MFKKLLALTGLVSAGVLLLFINTTPPSRAGASGILLVFILIYIVITTITTYLLLAISRLYIIIGKRTKRSYKHTRLSVNKAYQFASVLSLGVMMILGMRSVGAVGLYESALVAVFMLIGCIYVYRRS
jgi:hypothetical protein